MTDQPKDIIATSPVTIEQIREQANDVYRRRDEEIQRLRKQRDGINKRIAELLPELEEAARVVRAVAPRRSRSKKDATS